MSRTPLFAAVKKALAVASHENGVLGADEAAIVATLRSGGRRAGARTRLGPARLRQEARTELDCHRRRRRRRTDGCLSFSAARREAGSVRSQQPLGRTHVHPIDLYKGMFCELGGEFVGTGHEDLQNLASEVGVEMQT